MPVAGRMADRVGGGHVALVGCVIATAATLPLVAVSSTTSFALLAVLLVARGVGIGAAMMPAMAAAYAMLQSSQVPRATSTLNALQRVGGSVGTALLAVVLQHQTRAGPTASAFAHTFVWATALTAAAVVPALLLAREERSARAHPLPAAA